MTSRARILDGRQIAAQRLEEIGRRIQTIRQAGIDPGPLLASLRVGEGKDAALYSKALERVLARVGLPLEERVLPEHSTEAQILAEIEELNNDPSVTGILVFSPLPAGVRPSSVLDAISHSKDVEGRRVLSGDGKRVVSPTAGAVVELVESAGCPIEGAEAVVVGHSDLVGKPAAILLLDRLATVTVCHKSTRDLEGHVRRADILVAAAGKPHLIRGEWIKPGAVVVDVGENVVSGKLVGDVEFEEAGRRAGWISPVPGGVGPLTNVMLVSNLLRLHEWQRNENGDS